MLYSNDYLMDFAQRTKENLKFIKEEAARQRASGTKEEDLTVFEVTQMINSFVGFIMFPKQEYFNVLDPNVEFITEESKRIFEKISANKEKYKYYSTYKKYDEIKKKYDDKENEKLSAKTLILHFRNAIGHDKLSVLPIDSGTTNIIKAFKIEDSRKFRDHIMKFSIEIPVDELEELIIGMCDLLLAHRPNAREYNG